VTVDALDRASKSLPELARKKCQDIVTIYRAYLEELSKGYIDGNTVLDNLKSEIPESDYIAESDIYIRDFFSFTEAQRSVIFALMKSAKSVSIALVQGNGKNCRIYPEKELLRLRSLAKKSGAGYSEFYQNAPLPPAYEKVANELFAYGDIQKTKGGEGIVIYEAESAKEEVLHLARRIKLLVKQGYRYKDISVLAGDMEGYIPLIKKIFAQEDIPYFANEQKITQLSTKTIDHGRVKCYVTNILNSDGHEYIICNSAGISDKAPSGGTFMLHSVGCKKCNEKTNEKTK
jgi:ATP-dependent helicase/nuclease subunit B